MFFYVSGGVKTPILLEDQTDAEGKASAIRIADGKPVLDENQKALRFGPTELAAAETDAALRGVIQQALDTLALANPDPDAREHAIQKLGNSHKLKNVPILQARLAQETDSTVKRMIYEAIAMLQLGGADHQVEIAALQKLAALKSIGSRDMIKALAESKSTPPEVSLAARQAAESIDEHIKAVNFFGTIFRGLSLGSILLVVTLGLAITFGLMGVINMAHGEMIAVGAYTTYVVQNIFGSGFACSINLPFSVFGHPLGFSLHLPGLNATGAFYESYFLFALPLSFFMAALAGLALERSVIRFLYRRPLESLLATWGVYPIAYIIPLYFPHSGAAAWVAKQGGYSIADILAKCLYGLLIYRIARLKSFADDPAFAAQEGETEHYRAHAALAGPAPAGITH